MGLVLVPKETKGDLGLSLGGVSIAGVMGDVGQFWEIQSMSSVGFRLERQDTRGLDMKRGAVGVVSFTGVGGALALGGLLANFLKGV